MSGRIDYARFIVGERVSGRASEVLRGVRDRIKMAVIMGKPEWNQMWEDKSWWSGSTLLEYYQLDIKGELADVVMRDIQIATCKYLCRLDWRVEIHNQQFDHIEVREAMRGRANQKVRFHEDSSAPRKNNKGRAYGGISYYSGSSESERRMVYYQRADGPWVCECRFSGKQTKRIVQDAVERYQSFRSAHSYDVLTEALDTFSTTLIEERTGIKGNVLYGFEQRTETDNAYNQQETLLEQMDQMWGMLTPEAQEAFIAVNYLGLDDK